MDARMRRYAPQASPDRAKVRVEARHHPAQEHHQGEKIPVVYYLCRNRHLEHPHFVEVPVTSPEGLYLRDVIDRLNALRGKKMAAMYSWSCKRSYKNGFVWHDLSEDDLIPPAQGNEYVLKGSELLDQTPPDRNNRDMCNANIQNLKTPSKDPPPISSKGQEAFCSSSSAGVAMKKTKFPPRSPTQPVPLVTQEDELSPSTRKFTWSGNFSPEPDGTTTSPSAMGSPNSTECKIYNPVGAQDASTQTDERGGRRTDGFRNVAVSTSDVSANIKCNGNQTEKSLCLKEGPEIVKVQRSPPPAISSCGKMNTLESLIRDEVKRRNNFRILESEDIFLPTGPKLKPTDMLMNLITCGSTSVKDHYGFGFVPTYRPKFADMHFTSPLSANSMILGEVNCLPEGQTEMCINLKKKECVSGSMAETNKCTEEIGGLSKLRQSSSMDDGRRKSRIDAAAAACLTQKGCRKSSTTKSHAATIQGIIGMNQ